MIAGAAVDVAPAAALAAEVGITVKNGPRVEPVQLAPVTLTAVVVSTHVCANAWLHA